MLGWEHVERRFPTGGGGHRFDGLIACAVWNLPATGAESRAQLLLARIQVPPIRPDKLLHRQRTAASRRRCDQPTRFGSDECCAGVHLAG